MPYGYEPSDYRKDYGFVAGAANAIASGVIGLSEEHKRKEALELEYAKAEKLATEKKELINYSYKTLRNLASRKIDKLIEFGEIKPEEKPAMLKVLVQPDKFTNFRDYYQVNGKAFDELTKTLDERIAKAEQLKTDTGIKQTIEGFAQQPAIGFQNPETEAVAGDVGASMADPTKASEATQQTQPQGPWSELGTDPEKGGSAPTQQQPIQTIGQQQPAKLPIKEEAGWNLAGKYTKGQTEGSLAFQSLKSRADLVKEAQAKEKGDLAAQNLELRKKRLDFDKNREERMSANDAIKWARLNLDKDKFKYVQGHQMTVDFNKDLDKYVNADVALAQAEAQADAVQEEIRGLQAKLDTPEGKIEPEPIEDKISKLNAEYTKKNNALSGIRSKVIEYKAQYETTSVQYLDFVKKVNESGTVPYIGVKKTPTEKPKESPKEAPAPAPSPSGSGTPAPVIGGASPKLLPKDTVIAGTLPGSIKKPQTKAELIDWLKNVKKMPPDAIERYVAMQNQKGLFLK